MLRTRVGVVDGPVAQRGLRLVDRVPLFAQVFSRVPHLESDLRARVRARDEARRTEHKSSYRGASYNAVSYQIVIFSDDICCLLVPKVINWDYWSN